MTAGALIVIGLLILAAALVLGARSQSRGPAPRPVTPLAPSRPKRQLRGDVPTALYQYPHADRSRGRVYFGISNDPPARARRWEADANSPDPRKRARASWWHQSTKRMEIVAQYPNRRLARLAEDEAIAQAALRGEPIANYQGNPLRRARRAA